MTTVLTLSTGTDGPAPQRVAPISGATPAQSRVRQTLGGLTQAYHALTMTQKGGWQTVAHVLNANQGRVGKHKITPANAFVTLNSALLACGQSVLSNAPTDLNAPPVLPAVTVQSSAPVTARDAANAAFTLNLVCAGYSSAVQILAAPPAPAGKNTFPDNAFKAIGSVGAIPPSPVNIAYQYNAVFGTPEVGSQIALKLIATSPAGIRLSPLVVTAIVTAAGADTTPPKSPLHMA